VNNRPARQILLLSSVIAAVWAIVVRLSGGLVLQVGSFQVFSSRDPERAAIIALLSAIGAWLLTPLAERQRVQHACEAYASGALTALQGLVERTAPVRLSRRLPPQIAPLLAVSAATIIVIVGLARGVFSAGGSDSYGYVSQAELWAHGTLHVEQPFARSMRWPLAPQTLAPLGYRPNDDGTEIVPVYAPGLPMVMAIFQTVGGRDAVFYVVPILGGVAVLATYLLGARAGGRMVGCSAAILLATSPVFLMQLLLPMSDVPATAWWALSLAAMLGEGRKAALFSGLAAGAAIVTRPNLVPLAIVPAALLLWRTRRAPGAFAEALRRAALFAAGTVPACLVVAFLNNRWYGSPLSAGYGSFELLYGTRNLVPNLQRYPRWLLRTETPLVLLGLLAPIVTRRKVVAVASLCFVGIVFLSYLFHFPNDDWFWLRYLLPAFPAILVLTSLTLAAMLARFERGLRVAAMAAIVAAVGWHGISFTVRDGVFRLKEGERKTRAIGEYIANHFDDRSVFIATLHSGSIRYYSGRITVRFDLIPERFLDRVVADLGRLGYRPYIVVEESEEEGFRERFSARSGYGALDWPPAVLLDHSTTVKIFDPAQRPISEADRAPTAIIR
jgi:hypothetical protein